MSSATFASAHGTLRASIASMFASIVASVGTLGACTYRLSKTVFESNAPRSAKLLSHAAVEGINAENGLYLVSKTAFESQINFEEETLVMFASAIGHAALNIALRT